MKSAPLRIGKDLAVASVLQLAVVPGAAAQAAPGGWCAAKRGGRPTRPAHGTGLCPVPGRHPRVGYSDVYCVRRYYAGDPCKAGKSGRSGRGTRLAELLSYSKTTSWTIAVPSLAPRGGKDRVIANEEDNR